MRATHKLSERALAKPYPLNPAQFAAVCALPGPDRYRHFVGRVADWQVVWGLRDEEGWVSAGDDDGNRGFPVWPHPDYAMACATGAWAGNTPAPIAIHVFLERWLANLAEDGERVAVFPTATMRGVFVPALQLQRDLQDELSRIE
jgi:hypothetical protein